ncbi:ABC transporter ATP-binding protein [Pseudanabaena sp. FACHB-2040]|uniref:ABC transporter ATP-binding protein n=1 Tax=Pseudanabaena sp. FACHB-2040 TaxID=2692859 RepID=UPI001689C841|nr:ABC transporter ATP-binding protein [Pseudanabaena sp. FACHB-2040]MBD2258344.1 ABC transporter ATP-binding protein [Pseudanabaena sp. FACHB-2040]
MPLLQVNNLSKRFPISKTAHLHAVDRVSFDIHPGESVGLVGESGCGKSTLIRLITRLLDPTSGEIRFEDTIISTMAARQFPKSRYRGKIQLVFQDPTDSLNPRFTAYDTITEPIRQLSGKRDSAHLRQRAAELAELVGLPQDLLSRFPHQLSGGQKARVGIARAIALSPKLLVLDEPTSALDVSVQAIILHLLADLKARLGMSYLFVSHDLNVVRLLCDRILVMYLGQIVEAGTVSEIFNRPRHPYTEALLSAIPSFEAKPQPIPLLGEPRSPINPAPQVCRLYGRCPKGQDRCQQEMPLLQEAIPEHWAACHFPVGLSA